MKRLILLSIILGFFFAPLLKAEEISLTLEESLAIALRDNPDVLLKETDLKKAKAKLAEAHAGLFPTVNISGGWQETRGFYSKDISEIEGGANLRWYLYRGGMTINTIKLNEYGIAVSQAILDKAKLETVYSVQKAFYTLLLADEFARINKGILDNAKRHLEYLEARYLNGQASESDILSIKSSLGNVSEAYEVSLNQIESSAGLLNNLLHLEEKIVIKTGGQFSYEPKEVAYDEAILKAMSNRPEIRQYEAQEKQAKHAVEIAKAGGRPNIFSSWDYYTTSRQMGAYSPDPIKGWQDYNIFGVTISWPIFDGWQTKAKVDQAIVDLKQVQLLKDKVTQDIALELKNAYLDLRNAIAKIKSTDSELLLYTDTLKVAKEKYNGGIASSLDLDDVTLGFDVALFNQKEAIYDYIVAKAKFEKATGGL
jgi:outer membrane protein TolC